MRKSEEGIPTTQHNYGISKESSNKTRYAYKTNSTQSNAKSTQH